MMLEAGARGPDIQLTSTFGERFVLSEELKRSAVVLVFFKISCPTCQFTLPFVDRLFASEKAGSPRVYGISQDKTEATREFAQHFGLHFPILLDLSAEKYPASNAYGITNVPSLFLINPDGAIAWSLHGFHKSELEKLAKEFGRSLFEANERVPAMRPG